MKPHELLPILQKRGLIAGLDASCKPLSGGVSSDIWLVEDGQTKFVVKCALPKLRVPEDWRADVSRNRHEQEYMDYVARFLPAAVPRILHRDPEHGFFTMEYLGDEFANWKDLLLKGHADSTHAETAAFILGTIHRHSWNDEAARARFATTRQFRQLRIDPYLVTTGKRHARLQSLFNDEAERLAAVSLCLVHGDFSPKNILIGPERMVLLDCEVAWFGEPAFDVAFLANHLFLKALFHHESAQAFLHSAKLFWQEYVAQLGSDQLADMEKRVCRLLLMLLLARLDGKSPVEYVTDESKRACVRSFVTDLLPAKEWRFDALAGAWQDRLKAFCDMDSSG